MKKLKKKVFTGIIEVVFVDVVVGAAIVNSKIVENAFEQSWKRAYKDEYIICMCTRFIYNVIAYKLAHY